MEKFGSTIYSPPPFSPEVLGLPYREYRPPYQWDSIEKGAYSPAGRIGLCLPTGAGKSLSALSIAMLRRPSGRVAILTSTKALQDQVLKDFGSLVAQRTLADIRGHNAYPCRPTLQEDGTWVCFEGVACPYRRARGAAENAPIVLSNYSFWITDIVKGSGTIAEGVETLICDETHQLLSDSTGAFSIQLYSRFFRKYQDFWPKDAQTLDADGWRLFLSRLEGVISERVKALKNRMMNLISGENPRSVEAPLRYYGQMLSIIGLVGRLDVGNANWIARPLGEGRDVELIPVWPGRLLRDWVYPERVVFMSATLTGKVIEQLGVDSGEYSLFSYPSMFPLANRPFVYLPTVKLDYRSTDVEMNTLIAVIDQIIRGRLDRKILLHSVSYERARYIASRSLFSQIMITHDPKHTRDAVKLFRDTPPPVVLVSPALEHGWDFPSSSEGGAQTIIAPKLHWVDRRDPLVERRQREDSLYIPNLAMQALVQSSGRIIRGEKDIGETLMLDKNFGWFWGKHQGLAPEWFAVIKNDVVPQAPKR